MRYTPRKASTISTLGPAFKPPAHRCPRPSPPAPTMCSAPAASLVRFSASQLLPTGGTVELLFGGSQNYTNAFGTPSPNYGSQGGISLTQPLLRNAGPLVTEANIILAQIQQLGPELPTQASGHQRSLAVDADLFRPRLRAGQRGRAAHLPRPSPGASARQHGEIPRRRGPRA